VSGSTDSKGEYKYTPTKLGKYMVECAGKAPMIDLRMILDQPSQFGAVCGDGKCEADKYETRANCPDDCTVCGDAVCEGNEDKDSCPDDCLICGDGVCDPEEYTEQGCSCIEDCIVCGDGRCDSMYASETPEKCPQDCGSGPKPVPKTDFLRDYWWAIAAGAAVLVFLFLKREGLHMYFGRGGEKPAKEDKPKKVPDKRPAKGWVRDDAKKKAAEDEDVMGIVSELMESGVSDKNIRKKMVEFGLDEDEAERIIEKAKK
jgi:hypothetical protein